MKILAYKSKSAPVASIIFAILFVAVDCLLSHYLPILSLIFIVCALGTLFSCVTGAIENLTRPDILIVADSENMLYLYCDRCWEKIPSETLRAVSFRGSDHCGNSLFLRSDEREYVIENVKRVQSVCKAIESLLSKYESQKNA